MSFLFDTNVLSELRRGPQADERLRGWNSGVEDGERFTSIIVIAELMKGAALRRRKDIAGGAILDRWIAGVVGEFEGRILPIDLSTASVWAQLMAQQSRPPIDMLIAATAIGNGMTLVTRNISDFEGSGARVLNPWTYTG